MIDIKEDITKPKVWITEPSQLTLEQALEILNPDSGYQYMSNRRGAYKRLLIELGKDKKRIMTKELEALECSDKTEDSIVERNTNCLLHNIENGNFIKCDVCDVNWHKGCMCCVEHLKNSEEINTIKQALIKAQEQEKLLKIIKERHIDIISLEECIKREMMGNIKSALEYYNENYTLNYCMELAKEEFDLLKEWLNNENNNR